MVLKMITPVKLGPGVGLGVKKVDIRIAELFELGFVKADTADED